MESKVLNKLLFTKNYLVGILFCVLIIGCEPREDSVYRIQGEVHEQATGDAVDSVFVRFVDSNSSLFSSGDQLVGEIFTDDQGSFDIKVTGIKGSHVDMELSKDNYCVKGLIINLDESLTFSIDMNKIGHLNFDVSEKVIDTIDSLVLRISNEEVPSIVEPGYCFEMCLGHGKCIEEQADGGCV